MQNAKPFSIDTAEFCLSIHDEPKYIEDVISSYAQIFKFHKLRIIGDSCKEEYIKYIEELVKEYDLDSSLEIVNYKNLAKSLNYQIKTTKKPYIVRIDGDDVILPERKNHLKYLEGKKFDIAHASCWAVNGFFSTKITNKFTVVKRTIRFKETFYLKYKINPIVHPTCVIRTEFFLENKYREDAYRNEDFATWLELPNSTVYLYYKNPVIIYRGNLDKYKDQKKDKINLKNLVKKLIARSLVLKKN